MRIEKLENIAEVIAGQSPPSDTYNQFKDGLPFFQGNADFGDMFPTARYWCTAPKKIALPNDILMTVRAPVGPVNICNIESCIGRGLSAIRVKKNHSYKYIYYFLKSHERQIAKFGVGSTFKAITQKDIKALQIPLPDKIEDQTRIANILSKAEALIKQRNQSIDLLDEFLKSTFLDIFGDPLKNDKKWKQDKVENYTDCIVPGRDKPKSFTGETPWFTTDDLIDKGYVVISKKELGLSNTEIDEVKAKRIPVGSVLMTCVGDLGIVSINNDICVVNQQLHAFQCKPMLNNVFLMFNLSFMKSYMYKMASTTTVPYMNKTICNSIPIFSPPISLQTQFSIIVEKTEVLRTQYQESLNELENLFGSLSQRAFKGELDLSKLEVYIKDEEYQSFTNDRTHPEHFPEPEIIVEKKKPKEKKHKEKTESSMWETARTFSVENKNILFSQVEGDAVMRLVFSKKTNGFTFQDFEAFLKKEGFNFDFEQIRDYLFSKLETKEFIQYYSSEKWMKNNFKSRISPLQDDFAGTDGNIWLVPRKNNS